jgi:hypothetical protein
MLDNIQDMRTYPPVPGHEAESPVLVVLRLRFLYRKTPWRATQERDEQAAQFQVGGLANPAAAAWSRL